MPLIRRLLATLIALLGVLTTVFIAVRAVPGDPVDVLLGERASSDDRARLRHAMRLDGNFLDQGIAYATDLADLSLGQSVAMTGHAVPVITLMRAALPATIALALMSMLVALLIALPLGTFAALYQGRFVDHVGRAVALFAVSTPVFVSAPLAVWLLAVEARWLPTPAHDASAWQAALLPAAVVGFALAGRLARLLRATFIDVMQSPLPSALFSRGLSRPRIVLLHLLPAALLPVLSVIAGQFGAMLGGALIAEKIFGRPGLGTLLLDAIAARDAPVVQGAVLLIATTYVLVHLGVDICVGLVDPRTAARADAVAQ